LGARRYERAGFDVWLVFRLARRPVWLLGLASMILGFVFQISALRFGPLALVQPVLALELLLVFGFMTVIGRRLRVQRHDWLAAIAMSAGIGLFLGLAAPSGGRPHAPASSWWLAGLVTLAIVLLALTVAFGPGHHPGTSRSRRAAALGCATGISWGFVAAVIKELSSHLGDGAGAIASSWSLYVLIVAGAATTLLAAHALAAGPLAASQPGFTILDPLSAGMLGLFLFRRAHPGRDRGSGRRGGDAGRRHRGCLGAEPQPPDRGRARDPARPPSRIPTAHPPRTGPPLTGLLDGVRASSSGCLCCAAGPVWVRPRCYGRWPSARPAGECVAHRARACSDSRPAQELSDRLASSERLLHFAAAPNEKRPVPGSEPACELRFWRGLHV
jgi:drug/metabolite transporter (DMT)-like permease